jgi:uncharacterized protein with HEPN domain
MLPDKKDAALLWDMLTAATEIAQFVEGLTYAGFQSNKMLRYAVYTHLPYYVCPTVSN